MQSSQQQTQHHLPRSPTRSPHRKKQSIASPRVKKASVYNVKRVKNYNRMLKKKEKDEKKKQDQPNYSLNTADI